MAVGARRIGMDVELAEIAAEALLAVVVESVVAEDKHAELTERLVQLLHLAVGERASDVDASDLSADMRRDRAQCQGLVGQGGLLWLAQPASR